MRKEHLKEKIGPDFKQTKRVWDEHEVPTDVMDVHGLIYSNKEAQRLCPFAHWTTIGKWTMFYRRDELDEAWIRAVSLYRAGKFPGVREIKVSTGLYNPRGVSPESTGVILYYCGPFHQKERMMDIGWNLLRLMEFYETKSPRLTFNYKTNVQSVGGTQATGQRVNHIYAIEQKQYCARMGRP